MEFRRGKKFVISVIIMCGCLIATFFYFREKAKFVADKAIAHLSIPCARSNIRLGPIPSEEQNTIGWMVEYDVDILGPGPIHVYVSVLGDFKGTDQ